ncbi:MAG: hypothetical protein GC154_06095 [bacterium]|nr:hypothetical protein [bacterium]
MIASLNRSARAALFALIVIRPSLDALTEYAWLGAWKINPAALTGGLAALLGALWLITLKPADRRRTMMNQLGLIFAGWLLCLLPWALVPMLGHGVERAAGLREWLRLLSYLPLIWLGVHEAAGGRARALILAIAASAVVPAITGAAQGIFHTSPVIQGLHRIRGTFVHPNPFSFYLLTAAAAAYWLWRTERRKRWAAALAALLAVLLATFSLTGLGMLGVWMAAVAWGEGGAARWSVIALGVMLIAGILATDTGRTRLAGLTRWDNLDEIERTQRVTGSHTWRLLNWRYLIREWKKQPVFGYGLASIPRVNPNINKQSGVGHDAHNDYVRYLVETGAVGLTLWLTMLAGVGAVLYRAWRKARAPDIRRLSLIGLALFCAWAAGSLNDNLISATAYQYPLWLMMAMAAGGGEETTCAS